jgi:hypothetical protein
MIDLVLQAVFDVAVEEVKLMGKHHIHVTSS